MHATLLCHPSACPMVSPSPQHLHAGCPSHHTGPAHPRAPSWMLPRHPPCETSTLNLYQWTVHPNTSTQLSAPAPTPPLPTPSVFLATVYCRPAWGLTHSGDLTESSHQLWEEEVDSGALTHALHRLMCTHALLTWSPPHPLTKKRSCSQRVPMGRSLPLRRRLPELALALTHPYFDPCASPCVTEEKPISLGEPPGLWAPARP